MDYYSNTVLDNLGLCNSFGVVEVVEGLNKLVEVEPVVGGSLWTVRLVGEVGYNVTEEVADYSPEDRQDV